MNTRDAQIGYSQIFGLALYCETAKTGMVNCKCGNIKLLYQYLCSSTGENLFWFSSGHTFPNFVVPIVCVLYFPHTLFLLFLKNY